MLWPEEVDLSHYDVFACCRAEEIERCREAVRSKLQHRQSQVADLNEVQGLLVKLERCGPPSRR